MDYKTISEIKGPNLTLRLIQPADAAYVHGLRTSSDYNAHLSKVCGTVEDQRRWINNYKDRETEGFEFYYIIERNNGTPCGTIRLYDIKSDRFTWGSWILDHNKPAKAALESAVLSFSIGFINLDLDLAYVEVRMLNTHAADFYRRLGMSETHKNGHKIYFTYHRARFTSDRMKYFEHLKETIRT